MRSGLALTALLLAGCSAHVPAARSVALGAAWDGSLDPDGPQVELTRLDTGTLDVDRSVLLDLADPRLADHEDRKVPVPVFAWLVHHPTKGDVLIDSGLDSSFARSGHGNFGGLAVFVSLAHQEPGQDTASQLRAHGVAPERLRMIVLSHLDPDHTAGMPELPHDVPVVAGPGAVGGYESIWYAPYDHLAGIESIQTLDLDGVPAGELGQGRDLLGDGSLIAVSTPGHAPGNLSFLLRTAQGFVLLACDASHTLQGLELGVAPGKASDPAAAKATLERLRAFAIAHPEVKVLPGHDEGPWSAPAAEVAHQLRSRHEPGVVPVQPLNAR